MPFGQGRAGYMTTGSAQLGNHYSLSGTVGTVEIPAGASSTQLQLHAFNVAAQRRAARATIKLVRSTSYRLSKAKKATVTISAGP